MDACPTTQSSIVGQSCWLVWVFFRIPPLSMAAKLRPFWRATPGDRETQMLADGFAPRRSPKAKNTLGFKLIVVPDVLLFTTARVLLLNNV